MPTAKPRISIVVTERQASLLRRLAAVQERSVSGIVGDLLDQVEPLLEDVASTLEALQAASERVRGRMGVEVAADLESAQRALEPHLAGILDHFRMIGSLADDVALGAAGTEEEPATTTRPDGSQPPYSNTGVRPSREGGSRSAQVSHRRASNG